MATWAVQAPDGKVIQFPDNFTEQDVNREMYKMYSTPPGVPRPQVNMQGSALGQAVYGPASNDDSLRAAGYAGPAPSQINPYTSSAAMAAGPAALGASAAGKVGSSLWNLLGRIPKVGPFAQATALSEGIGYARRNVPGGKYIPSVAEIAPYFMAGRGAAAEGEAAAAPKNAGDPFRNVPDPEADVFREPAPRPVPPTREAAAQAAVEEFSARSGVGVQNAPYTYSGESALRQVLTGLGNKDLLQIAKSRGINVAQEAQLKPGVADSKIIEKVINDFSPDELDEFGNQYLEATRMGRPAGVGPEAYTTKVLQQFFPDLKLPQARLQRTQKAFTTRKNSLSDLLTQAAGQQ